MADIAPLLASLAGAIGVADMIPTSATPSVEPLVRRHMAHLWGALASLVGFSRRADGASRSLIMAATAASSRPT